MAHDHEEHLGQRTLITNKVTKTELMMEVALEREGYEELWAEHEKLQAFVDKVKDELRWL